MAASIIPTSFSLNTVDLRAKINELRKEAGESPIRNDQFLARVRDELLDESLVVQKFCMQDEPGKHGGQTVRNR